MASSSKSPMRHLSCKSEEFRNTTLDTKVRAGMEEMRLAGILCDMTLVAGNVDIQAHKLVLANTSHYFYSMFTGGLKETESSRIVMDDLEPEILTILIEYCYSSKITITQDNVKNLYLTSMMLKFKDVNKACSQFLMNQIKLENSFEIKTFAKTHDDIGLVSKCDSYILEHFGEIMKQEEFLKINKEDLLVLMARKKIVLENEEQVFNGILSWIDHDRSLRSGFFKDLMEEVRINSLSSEYLVTKIEKEPLIKNCDFLKDKISKILFDRLLKKDSSPGLESVSKATQFLNNMLLLVIGGHRDRTCLQTVEAYSFRTNSWSSLCEMPDCKSYCGAAVVGSKVYVVGGEARNTVSTSSVFMYDPSVDSWSSSIPSMQNKRNGMGVAVLNDRIYAIGGCSWPEEGTGGNLNTAEVLDLTVRPQWRNIASMNTRRRGVGVAVLNGRIFAVGGWGDGIEILSSVESYDPERNVWSPVADLSVPRFGAGVGVLDGVLYCVGGKEWKDGSTNTVEKYCEDTNTWSQVVEMNHSRAWPGVITHEGRLFVVGGCSGDSYLSSMEMYDPVTNTWTLVADMSVGRCGPAVALINKPFD